MRRLFALVLAVGMIATLSPQSGGAARVAQTCDRESVADLVRSFVRAYNRGDSQKLDQIWAAEPEFEWYAVSPDERERTEAYDRDTLVSYFELRHRLNDRLWLKRLRVNPPNQEGTFGIANRLRRQSDQPSGRGLYHGKASAKEVMTLPTLDNLGLSRCQLFVWSMGRKQR